MEPAAVVLLGALSVFASCSARTMETHSMPARAPDGRPGAPEPSANFTQARAGESAPPEISCLIRHYGGTAVSDGGRWWLDLGAGRRFVYDDGRKKSVDERLDSPDIEDMFAAPYRRGPIAPVIAPNGDPGRARVPGLFAAIYGDSEAAVRRQLVTVTLLGHAFSVHRSIARALERVGARLEALSKTDRSVNRYFEHPGGGFAYRNVAGTERPSGHSFGIAVDLDPKYGAYHRWDRERLRWRNEIPQAVVGAFEAEGFVWGGRWYHYDTIHFEFRPELLDDTCRAHERSRPSSDGGF